MSLAKEKYNQGEEITLSIETAIAGGSLSLLRGTEEIAGWINEAGISKVEDLLEQIENLLIVNKIKKEQIKLICVSKGAGSLTGEKIGQAIAKGLSRAWKTPLRRASILECVVLTGDMGEGEYIAALKREKQFIWQCIEVKAGNQHAEVAGVNTSKIENFYKEINNFRFRKVILFQNNRTNSDLPLVQKETIILKEKSLATLIGKNCVNKYYHQLVNASDNVEIIY